LVAPKEREKRLGFIFKKKKNPREGGCCARVATWVFYLSFNIKNQSKRRVLSYKGGCVALKNIKIKK
jgi:hypothetical protein